MLARLNWLLDQATPAMDRTFDFWLATHQLWVAVLGALTSQQDSQRAQMAPVANLGSLLEVLPTASTSEHRLVLRAEKLLMEVET